MRKNFAEKDPIRLTPDRKSEQFVAQILQRQIHMILDRADRQPQPLADLLVRHVLEKAHAENLPALVGQLVHRLPQLRMSLS